jgi:hypothetical protein
MMLALNLPIPPAAWPWIFGACVVVALTLCLALVLKGDVNAQFSHGSTQLRLEAKERQNGRKRKATPV